MRPISRIGLVTLLTLAPATVAGGQALGTVLMPTGIVRPCFPTEGAHRAFVQGDRLDAAYRLLLERSPTFAAAMAGIESTNAVRIRIGYRDQLMRRYERLMGEDRSGAVFLADGAAFNPAGTILCGVRVVFFTEALEEELLRAGVPESAIVEDLAAMLAHEVFGHLVPFAEQRVTAWPTPCRDPEARDLATTGCGVDRENVIRSELGFAERTRYTRAEGPLVCELLRRPCRVPRAATASLLAPPVPPAPPDMSRSVTPRLPHPTSLLARRSHLVPAFGPEP